MTQAFGVEQVRLNELEASDAMSIGAPNLAKANQV